MNCCVGQRGWLATFMNTANLAGVVEHLERVWYCGCCCGCGLKKVVL